MPNRATARAPERDLRCQILDTALQLFSRNGYFNTSVLDTAWECAWRAVANP